MFPAPPTQVFGSPDAAGPDGLEAGVKKLPQFAGPPPETPEAQDPYANLDRAALLKRFKEAKDDGLELRWVHERGWWRVLLYLLDRQWIFWDTRRNEWRDKRLKKWIPKPVTGKPREVQSAIRSMFAAVQLGIVSRPNGNDPKNIATANTVDGLQPLIHDEHKMDSRQALFDFWMVNLGSVFGYVWWDEAGGETKAVVHDQCVGCGQTIDPAELPNPAQFVCPVCGQIESTPVTVGHAPVGAGCTDVVSPFEILLPSYASTFDECRRLIRMRWRPRSYYEEHYPEIAPKLSYQKQTNERSLQMFKALAAQSTLGTLPFSTSTGGSSTSQAEGLTEYEYWEKPCPQWPKGLFFRVIGDSTPQILEEGPDQPGPGAIPTETVKGQVMWPWFHIGYEEFGGRLWSLGAIDPILQKVDQLNQLDSQCLLSFQRMSNPIWIEPKGAEVEKFTGEPGLVVKYNVLGTTGQGKPERIPGEAIPASTFTLREQILRDIEELSGTYDILKGAKPTGVEAFSALQLLVERSQSRFTAAFVARGQAYREWFKIALELERKYGPTQRTLSLLGPNGTWTFQTFQRANLLGDINIVVEDGTNVPKTALGKRAAMEQANNMRFIDPTDLDTRHAFLTEMGLTSLIPSLDSAKTAALRQQDAFEQWAQTGMQGPPPLKIQPWDNPMILLTELRKWANSDKMQALMAPTSPQGPIVTEILTQFYTQLAMMEQQAMMQQAAAQAGPGGGDKGPGHGAGGGQAMGRSNANSNAPGTAAPTERHPGAAAA